MMEKLLARGDALARDATTRKVGEVAQQLRAIFGAGSVSVEDAQVLVKGPGILKRWLIDPSVRFLAGGLK
jgi:hypothetical protein